MAQYGHLKHQLFTELDSNGDPLSGGLVYTYEAGTTTDKVTYSDTALTIPNSNPVVLDSRGSASIYYTGTMKIIVKNADDVTQYTMDNIEERQTVSDATSLDSLAMYSLQQEKTGAYSPVEADNGSVIRLDTSGGAGVITLPDSTGLTADYRLSVVKTTADSNVVTISRSGSDTVNGGTSVAFNGQYEEVTCCLDQSTGQWRAFGAILAPDAIETASIKDLAVTTSKLNNLAVTLAKIANGTQGGLVVFSGASGTATDIGAGAASQFLQSTGAGSDVVWGYPVISKQFTSTEYVLTGPAGNATFAHGLGVEPKIVQGYFLCKTADLGYAVGEKVLLSGPTWDAGSGASFGTSVSFDATNLYLQNGSSAIRLPLKGTGVHNIITYARWTIVLKAFA